SAYEQPSLNEKHSIRHAWLSGVHKAFLNFIVRSWSPGEGNDECLNLKVVARDDFILVHLMPLQSFNCGNLLPRPGRLVRQVRLDFKRSANRLGEVQAVGVRGRRS